MKFLDEAIIDTISLAKNWKIKGCTFWYLYYINTFNYFCSLIRLVKENIYEINNNTDQTLNYIPKAFSDSSQSLRAASLLWTWGA